MRCSTCGRPPQAEVVAGREVLLPREPYCGGCGNDLADAKAAVDPKGVRIYTDAQAAAYARNRHADREMAMLLAQKKTILQNIVNGKHGDDPSKSLQGTVAEIASAKANAQDLLNQLADMEAMAAAEAPK